MPKGSISHNHEWCRRNLNNLFIAFSGGDNRRPILSSAEVFPPSEKIEANFSAVRDEIMVLVNKRKFTKYQDIDIHRAKEVSLDWKIYYVMMLGKINPLAIEQCPTVVNLTKDIPGVNNVSITILEPGVCLAAHKGPYAGILRYHLGIKVPKVNPPLIRVDTETYTWKEGESMVIDDVFDHEVVNNSDDIRVVLLIDFMRPMNPVLHQINRFSLYLKRRWAGHLIEKANN